jgi:hypothetical protein
LAILLRGRAVVLFIPKHLETDTAINEGRIGFGVDGKFPSSTAIKATQFGSAMTARIPSQVTLLQHIAVLARGATNVNDSLAGRNDGHCQGASKDH